jgi:hypothetical protein
VESLHGEAEDSSLQTRVRVRKGHNIRFDLWMSFKFLKKFPDTVFHGVDVESLLGEAEVSSLQSKVPVRKS